MIVNLCRTREVSVVHTHGYRSDIIGGLAGRKAAVPIVTTVHGFTGGGLKNRALEAIQRQSFRYFDAVAAVSRPQADQLRASGVPANRLHVIPNAFNGHVAPLDRDSARRTLGLPTDGIVAGWVGRVSHEKGPDVFIDSLASLSDLSMLSAIVGDGPLRSSLDMRAAETVPNGVRWLGAVPDAARYFAAFDLLVMSSRTEGLPMVLLEAMAAGIPIVTTSVGGIPDLLSSAEALLVPPDDAAALAAAIRATVSDLRAAAARAKAAQLRQGTSFSVGPWSERYESLYRSLIAARIGSMRSPPAPSASEPA
jgi:glycosyltransferase involved in cell wall biosynthesis